MPNTKKGLRRYIVSFLKQRKKFAEMALRTSKSVKLQHIMIISGSLILKFNLIQNYNYWRHCFEVTKQSEQIYRILPSEKGKQQAIRIHMIQLMDECKKISATKSTGYGPIHRSKESKQTVV